MGPVVIKTIDLKAFSWKDVDCSFVISSPSVKQAKEQEEISVWRMHRRTLETQLETLSMQVDRNKTN